MRYWSGSKRTTSLVSKATIRTNIPLLGLNSFQKTESLWARNFSDSFEHEHDDKDDASAEALAMVADFGASSVERYAALASILFT